MSIDYTQGDPRLIMGPNGSRLQFKDGQPLMDRGLENLALISLFTSSGWCGNAFLSAPIGSDFEDLCRQPITRSLLDQIRDSAVRALDPAVFGRVDVAVTNPNSNMLQVVITIQPPGQEAVSLEIRRDGGVWLSQAQQPAYPKITAPDIPFLQFETGQIMEQENREIMGF